MIVEFIEANGLVIVVSGVVLGLLCGFLFVIAGRLREDKK